MPPTSNIVAPALALSTLLLLHQSPRERERWQRNQCESAIEDVWMLVSKGLHEQGPVAASSVVKPRTSERKLIDQLASPANHPQHPSPAL